MYRIPVWQMIKEAMTEIGSETVTNAEIRNYIFDHYGNINPRTINCQILYCSVNRQSRINGPENHDPRIANSQYDFLYGVGHGLVTLYNLEKHGKWAIASVNGKLVVKQLKEGIVA